MLFHGAAGEPVAKLSFRFEYRYEGQRGILVPVVLRSADHETDFFARIDTGASFCIFQRLHAETVGIAAESGVPTRISTVTGGFLAYAHSIVLGVLGIEVEATVYFAGDPAMPRDVPGQTGWLDRMRLALVDHDRQLYLSHHDDPADEE
jgi:hypothetical protein